VGGRQRAAEPTAGASTHCGPSRESAVAFEDFFITPCCALRRLLHEPNVSARRAPLSLQWSSLNRHCAEFRATLRGRSIARFSPDGLILTNPCHVILMMKRPHTDIPWNRQGGALVHAAQLAT
jgi:hypothetical protein